MDPTKTKRLALIRAPYRTNRLLLLLFLAVFTTGGIMYLQYSKAASPAPVAATDTSATSLDKTGATIPDTNYAIPTGAVFLSTTGNDSNPGTQAAPFKTVTKAINMVPNGGTVVVRGGIYHDGYRSSDGTTFGIQNKTMTIQAYPHEKVWFDGTDAIAAGSWASDGAGHWSVPWSTPSFCQNRYYELKYDAQAANNSGPCAHVDMHGDAAHPAGADPQMVFWDNHALNEATTLAGVTSGSFYYDWAARRLFIGAAPSGHTVELAARPVFLVMGGTATNNVKFLGLGFRRYASNEYSNQTGAAVTIYGTNTMVENSVFTENAGQGLVLNAQGGIVRHSVFARNGYNGSGSNGHTKTPGITDNLLVEKNVYANNNTEGLGEGCSLSCGQAGSKIAHVVGYTMRDNIVENNTGWGLWCDEACTGGVMVRNLVTGNTKGGLLYEVASGGIIASNLLIGNGHAGIQVAAATTKVYNNTIVGTTTDYAGSIWVYDDSRYIAKDGVGEVGPDTRDVEIVNNIISSGITGVKMQGTLTNGTNTTADMLLSAYDYNAYYRTGGSSQVLSSWRGPGSSLDYRTLASLTSAKGFEAHGIDVASGSDPFFVNVAAGNYGVRSGSPAYHASTTIPNDVAAAIGTTAKTGLSLGAVSWPGSTAPAAPTPTAVAATPTPTPTATPVVAPKPAATPVATPVAAPSAHGLSATYYRGTYFSGQGVSRTDANVDFNWGLGAPVAGLPVDQFSARWTGKLTAPTTGTYNLKLTGDDGLRLFLDGKLIIDAWNDHPSTTYSATVALVAGQARDLRIEYYENKVRANVTFAWERTGMAATVVPASALTPSTEHGLSATYMRYSSLASIIAVLGRTDANVNFDWGILSPNIALPTDKFAVSWTGKITPPTNGTYTFSTRSDDGVRLWVDGKLLVNHWNDHPAMTDTSAPVTLVAGRKYDIHMEYYENGGKATAQLLWTKPAAAQSIVPTSALTIN